MGNPPYKRLKRGEVERLVGQTISELWEDLKRPVREAGLGLSLNAFPDLCIAFYRWALWRLFEAEDALGRGTLAFITNRTFLTAIGYGGLRKMLRERFDTIRIVDLRGENRGALPATVEKDENVFKIEVGVCILVASATGTKEEGIEAEVSYADTWRQGAFSRREKLDFASHAAIDQESLNFVSVAGSGMARFKPPGFLEYDWPSLAEVFTYKSNGIVTYRDDFSYALSVADLSERIQDWLRLPVSDARSMFKDSAHNKTGEALKVGFHYEFIEERSYRPLDHRYLYAQSKFVDRLRPDFASNWGVQNFGLMCMGGGTGAGPAVWCHARLPDQHAFRGSYGGWIFPLCDPRLAGAHYIDLGVMAGLAEVYGEMPEPQAVFDMILALLSASSFTTRFAHDLEDDYPHVPFPAAYADFVSAARVGARIRELEGFIGRPAKAFHNARLEGDALGKILDVPTPARAWAGADGVGSVALTADGAFRIVNVPETVWKFAISGYSVLYKWLKARAGKTLHGEQGAALLRDLLDAAWRIEELVSLFTEADAILARVLDNTLTREELNVAPRASEAAIENESVTD